MSDTFLDPKTTAEDFWDGIYGKTQPRSGGRPGAVLKRFTQALQPGRALDMGCAKGDDSVWLAQQGWSVTAVDVSSTVLEYAAGNARKSGVGGRIAFERHDLSRSFPEGAFDLVFASFFHSPIVFDRSRALRRAAAAVVTGGHLLIIEHGSRAPWSWAPPDTIYPTAEESLATIRLEERQWERIEVASLERIAHGPDGQQAAVLDNVIFLRRRDG